ncbi:MAG: ABC transporter permease [Chloroflexi bacterium]|jgi:spermidine/putrescine transport system permease protein|nr:MAG: ABC transporter permease [Chloroflexota bacterium]
MATATAEGVITRASAPNRIGRAVEHWALPAVTAVAMIYLLIPIVVMIIFSFNDYQGKFNFIWHGFTLYGWLHPLDWPGLPNSLTNSLLIAFVSTVVATVLGTLIGLSLTRYQFRARGAINGLIFLPMATPEIVLGSSLLTLFVSTALPPLNGIVPRGSLFPLGLTTILIAHVMFNISYVVVTVKARLAGFDRHLEEAAMDLGANEWTTFWRVTFPLIFPGVMAAALLAFSLSIDDFVITNFVSGTTNTFPIWVWGIIKNALPVQINVVGSIVFLSAVAFVALTTLRSGRAARIR